MRNIKPYLITYLIWLFLQGTSLAQFKSNTYAETFGLMGSWFEITAVAKCEKKALAAIKAGKAEMQRIEKLISSWDVQSQTSEINRQAGIRRVKVDIELFELIEQSQRISELTKGAFDLSFASIDKVWHFDGSMTSLPDSSTIVHSIAKINYQNIILNHRDTSVFLLEKGMRIGFGGIGKGYAAKRTRIIMQDLGIKNGIVNAGGDLIAWGCSASRKPWKIGIADPRQKKRLLTNLEVKNEAVVTSGDAEKYVLIGGKRYAHIIDPRTGWPARGLKSVTIICEDAALADALATAVFVMGEKEGIEFMKSQKGVKYILVNEENKVLSSNVLVD